LSVKAYKVATIVANTFSPSPLFEITLSSISPVSAFLSPKPGFINPCSWWGILNQFYYSAFWPNTYKLKYLSPFRKLLITWCIILFFCISEQAQSLKVQLANRSRHF
jgi:hypothetical protein